MIDSELAPWTLEQIRGWLGGRTAPNLRAAVPVRRIWTDTRTLQPGDLFVALRGPNFDGHEFVARAMAAGAAGAIVDSIPKSNFSWLERMLLVPSTAEAMSTLAQLWRRQLELRVLAVTGSNGKTTVKEMLAGIVRAHVELSGGDSRQQVLQTEGNLNNTLGVPMTLLRLRQGQRWVVLEMGMNQVGELAGLTRMAAPDVALINNIQRAHVGPLGDLGTVAQAKAEIFEGLAPTGVAVFAADNPWRAQLRAAAGKHSVLEFELLSAPPAAGEPHSAAVLGWVGLEGRLVLALEEDLYPVSLQVPGRHNQANAVAAAATAWAAGVGADAIVQGLSNYAGMAGRLQWLTTAGGARLLDDTYNGNPDSVLAALEVLAQQPGRRILVLGDLGELGEHGADWHAELGQRARASGVDACYTLGSLSRATSAAFGTGALHCATRAELLTGLNQQLDGPTVVLIKGSRFMRMEQVVQALMAVTEEV